MTEQTPIEADFVDYDYIPTRSVLKIILEVPAESQKKVFDALGYPLSGETMRVAVVRMNENI